MQSVFDSCVSRALGRMFEDLWGGLSAELHHRPVWKPCVPYLGLRAVGHGTMGFFEYANVRMSVGACAVMKSVIVECGRNFYIDDMRIGMVLLTRQAITYLIRAITSGLPLKEPRSRGTFSCEMSCRA
jgi:hypothetical protein